MKIKKAQLKMLETIFILIFFFILLTFGLIFYSKVETSSLEQMKEIDFQRDILKSAIALTNFPELSCQSLSGEIEEGCIDLYKLKAFSELLTDDDFKRQMALTYFDVFGDSKIEVIEVYPEQSNYTLFDRSKSKFKSRKVQFIPIIVRNPIQNTNSFGYITMVIYK